MAGRFGFSDLMKPGKFGWLQNAVKRPASMKDGMSQMVGRRAPMGVSNIQKPEPMNSKPAKINRAALYK